MSAKKLETYSITSLLFSSFLHMVILFTILTALFLLLISKLEKEIFDREIHDNLSNTLVTSLQKAYKYGSLKTILQTIPLDRLQTFYSQPSQENEIYNKWLQISMFLTIGFLITIILILSLFLYFTCGKMIPLWHIVEENIIIFIIVGTFEAIFFLLIARKYIPCPPSFMMTTFFDDLKNI